MISLRLSTRAWIVLLGLATVAAAWVVLWRALPPQQFAIAEVIQIRDSAGTDVAAQPTRGGLGADAAQPATAIWLGKLAAHTRPAESAELQRDQLAAGMLELSGSATPSTLDRVYGLLAPRSDKSRGWRLIRGSASDRFNVLANEHTVVGQAPSAKAVADDDLSVELKMAPASIFRGTNTGSRQPDQSPTWTVSLTTDERTLYGLDGGAAPPALAPIKPWAVPRTSVDLAAALTTTDQPSGAYAQHRFSVSLQLMKAVPHCLRTNSGSSHRYVPLDPRTGSVLHDSAGATTAHLRMRLHKREVDGWLLCTRDNPVCTPVEEDQEIATGVRVVECPGARSTATLVEATLCPVGETDTRCQTRHGATNIGAVELVVLGRLQLVGHADVLAITPVELATPATGADSRVMQSSAPDSRRFGELWLDEGHALRLRFESDSGPVVRVQFEPATTAKPATATLSPEREPYHPTMPHFTRAVALPSTQPGIWRYMQQRSAVAISEAGEAPRVTLPGIGEFVHQAGQWRATGLLVAGPELDRGTMRQFDAPRYTVQVWTVDYQPWMGWLLLLTIGAVVWVCMAIVWAAPAGHDRRGFGVAPLDHLTITAATFVLALACGLGTLQSVVLAVSPQGQNSSLNLGRNLAAIVAGAGAGWLLALLFRAFESARTLGAIGSAVLGPDSTLPSGAQRQALLIAHCINKVGSGAVWLLAALVLLPWFDAAVAYLVRPVWRPGAELSTAAALSSAGMVALAIAWWAHGGTTASAPRQAWGNRLVLAACLLHLWALATCGSASRFSLVWVLEHYCTLGGEDAADCAAACAMAVVLLAALAGGLRWFEHLWPRFAPRRDDQTGHPDAPRWKAVLPEWLRWVVALWTHADRALRIALLPWFILAAATVLSPMLGLRALISGAWLVTAMDLCTLGVAVTIAWPGLRTRPQPTQDALHLQAAHWVYRAVVLVTAFIGVAGSDFGPVLVRAVPLTVALIWLHIRVHTSGYRAGFREIAPTLLGMVVMHLSGELWPAVAGTLLSVWLVWTVSDPASLRSGIIRVVLLGGMVGLLLTLLQLLTSPPDPHTSLVYKLAQADWPFLSERAQSMWHKFVERANCVAEPQFWGNCEQVLDAQRYRVVSLREAQIDVLASNAHSDLAWNHLHHVVGGAAVNPVSFAAVATLVAMLLLLTLLLVGRASQLHPIRLAACAVAGSLYVAYAALHVAGLASLVPLSGVPFPLVSYAPTTNLVAVALCCGALAAILGQFEHVPDHVAPARIAGGLGMLTGAVALVASMTSQPAPLVRTDPANQFFEHHDTYRATANLSEGSASTDPLTTACDDTLRIVELEGQPANAGPTRRLGSGLFRQVTAASSAAIVRVGWVLDPGAGENARQTLCTDPSCDLFVDDWAGDACMRLALRNEPETHAAAAVVARLHVEPAGLTACGGFRTAEAISVFPATHPQAAKGGAVLGLPVRYGETVHRAAWGFRAMAPRDATVAGGGPIALCLVAGPHLAVPLQGATTPTDHLLAHVPEVAVFPLAEGSNVARRVAVGEGSITLAAGGAPPHLPRRIAYTERLRAVWELTDSGMLRCEGDRAALSAASVAPVCDQRAIGDVCGVSEAGLAGVVLRQGDSRRSVRRGIHTLIERTDCAEDSEVESTLAVVKSSRGDVRLAPKLRALARRYRVPDPANKTSHPHPAHAATPRAELSWWVGSRTARAPTVVFLASPAFGIGADRAPWQLGEAPMPATDPLRSFWIAGRARAQFLTDRWRDIHAWRNDGATPEPPLSVAAVARAEADRQEAILEFCRGDAKGKDCEVLSASSPDSVAVLPRGAALDTSRLRVQRVAGTSRGTSAQLDFWNSNWVSGGYRVVDVARPVAEMARRAKLVSALHPDLQVALGNLAHDWLRERNQAARERTRERAHLRCIRLGNDTASALQACEEQQVAENRVHGKVATIAVVDYQAGLVRGLAEVRQLPPAHLRFATDQSHEVPLFVRGDTEAASTWKVVTLMASIGSLAPDLASKTNCDNQPVQTCPLAHGGAVDMTEALAESCNRYFAGLVAGNSLAQLELERTIADFGVAPVWAKSVRKVGDDFERSVSSLWLTQRSVATALPDSWAALATAGGLHAQAASGTAGTAEAAQAMERDASSSRWACGLGVQVSPYVVAALYANLARRLLPRADQSLATETPGFAWPAWLEPSPGSLRVQAPNGLQRRFESFVAYFSAAPARRALLDGLGGSIKYGTASGDRQLLDIASRIAIVGKTGTSDRRKVVDIESRGVRERRWSHFVSFVDPDDPLAPQRPLLVWVSVDADVSPDSRDFPSEFAAYHLAAHVWRLLANLPATHAGGGNDAGLGR